MNTVLDQRETLPLECRVNIALALRLVKVKLEPLEIRGSSD